MTFSLIYLLIFILIVPRRTPKAIKLDMMVYFHLYAPGALSIVKKLNGVKRLDFKDIDF